MAHGSWLNRTANKFGRLYMLFDLAVAGAAQGYSPILNALKVRQEKGRPEKQYVTFSFEASAVTGTNLDIALYGSDTIGGSKFLLKDALVADITDTTMVAGVIDLQAYPASFYWISVTGDNAETGNTLAINISGDLNGSQS